MQWAMHLSRLHDNDNYADHIVFLHNRTDLNVGRFNFVADPANDEPLKHITRTWFQMSNQWVIDRVPHNNVPQVPLVIVRGNTQYNLDVTTRLQVNDVLLVPTRKLIRHLQRKFRIDELIDGHQMQLHMVQYWRNTDTSTQKYYVAYNVTILNRTQHDAFMEQRETARLAFESLNRHRWVPLPDDADLFDDDASSTDERGPFVCRRCFKRYVYKKAFEKHRRRCV